MKFSAAVLLLTLTAPTATAFTPTFLPHTTKHSAKHSALNLSVGVVGGSSGAVGKEIIGVLENRNFDVTDLRIYGSARSAGKKVATKFGEVTCEKFSIESAKSCDIVFLAVSGEFALEHAEKLAESSVVIDNSSAFRMKEGVPLVIPEINGATCKGKKLIANPNCTTAIGLMAVNPLHKLFKMKRMLMSTYQASSGAGQEGMDELEAGTRDVVNGVKKVADDWAGGSHPLAFNLIPHIDKFQENGYTKEEMKVTWETRKIMGLDGEFPVSCTAVRIPIYRAHSETIVMETEEKVSRHTRRFYATPIPQTTSYNRTTRRCSHMRVANTGRS